MYNVHVRVGVYTWSWRHGVIYTIDTIDYVTGIGNSQFIAYDDNFAGSARVTFGARDLECVAIDTNRA